MYQFGYQQWVVFWQENALELVSNDVSHIRFTVLWKLRLVEDFKVEN